MLFSSKTTQTGNTPTSIKNFIQVVFGKKIEENKLLVRPIKTLRFNLIKPYFCANYYLFYLFYYDEQRNS